MSDPFSILAAFEDQVRDNTRRAAVAIDYFFANDDGCKLHGDCHARMGTLLHDIERESERMEREWDEAFDRIKPLAHNERPVLSRKAVRLLDIADQIGSARQLVEVGHMATETLSDAQRDPLVELLAVVADKLKTAAADIQTALRQAE